MSIFSLLVLAPVLFIALAVPFLAVWTPLRAIRGRASLRRSLEQEGYRVRRMELRWFTRGPFTDMRPAGLKHSDWLYRVVAQDREWRPRVAWIRWRPGWPWQPADRWQLRWDESPDLKPRGLTTPLFGVLMLVAMAVVLLLVYAAAQNLDVPSSTGTETPDVAGPAGRGVLTAETPEQAGMYELRCRGGDKAFRLERLQIAQRSGPSGLDWVALMSLEFKASPQAARVDGAGLSPGTCGWLDRPLTDSEPRLIRFETPTIHTTGPGHVVMPEPGSFPDAEYLTDPARYWSFFVFNTNNGYFQATSHRRWSSAPGAQTLGMWLASLGQPREKE